jgi:hypothetical protein
MSMQSEDVRRDCFLKWLHSQNHAGPSLLGKRISTEGGSSVAQFFTLLRERRIKCPDAVASPRRFSLPRTVPLSITGEEEELVNRLIEDRLVETTYRDADEWRVALTEKGVRCIAGLSGDPEDETH